MTLIARYRDLPARMALRLANRPRVRRLLGARYAAAIARHRPDLPRLTGIDRDIVDALNRDGIFMTTLDALGLPGSGEVLRQGQRLAAATAADARRNAAAGRDFNIVPPEAIVAQPQLFTWGLGDRLLAIAEAYLELPVAYDGVSIVYTVADGREVATRRWHRDWEDRRMMKVAIYCNDVDARGGPFEMIACADHGQSDAGGYRYMPASAADLAELFGEDYAARIVSCTGPAGTVIFTDTARFFHRGQPAIDRDRMAMFYSYFARTPRHPFYCERSGFTRDQVATLARGLPARQRAATLWRDALPTLVKAIPPAQL